MNVCPDASEWHRVYQELLAASSKMGATDAPPKPLILAGAAFSSASEKIERWRKTLEWAERRGLEQITGSVRSDRMIELDPRQPAWYPELDLEE